jgi:hypothetical protein
MWIGRVDVDANGIVLFDPVVVAQWRPHIKWRTDLFTELTTTDVGDEALRRGLFVPVLAIDDGGYDVIVRSRDEVSPIRGEVVVENGEFPLRIEHDLVVADLAVLREWIPELGWQHIPVPPGSYAATIAGFRQLTVKPELVAAGYELILDRRRDLPPVTGSTGRGMRVLNWWDQPTWTARHSSPSQTARPSAETSATYW